MKDVLRKIEESHLILRTTTLFADEDIKKIEGPPMATMRLPAEGRDTQSGPLNVTAGSYVISSLEDKVSSETSLVQDVDMPDDNKHAGSVAATPTREKDRCTGTRNR